MTCSKLKDTRAQRLNRGLLLVPLFLIHFSCLLTFSNAWSKQIKIKQKTVSATVIWEGDFSGQFDFSGPLYTAIKGEISDEKPKINPEACEIQAHFSEVVAFVKKVSDPSLKVQFTFSCGAPPNDWKYQTPSYVLSLERLGLSKTRVHFSEKMKNMSFIVSNFSL